MPLIIRAVRPSLKIPRKKTIYFWRVSIMVRVTCSAFAACMNSGGFGAIRYTAGSGLRSCLDGGAKVSPVAVSSWPPEPTTDDSGVSGDAGESGNFGQSG